jgi:hypothetical protein
MKDYYLVIEDNLLKLFYEFQSGQYNVNRDILFNLLNFYKKHLTNVVQLKRIGIKDTALLKQLAQQGYINETLSELAQKTKLKIILSKEKSYYPYVNINGDVFESNFTATYKRGNSKSKAVEHILALVKEGDKVEIYDKYLFCDNGDHYNINYNHNSVKIILQFVNSHNIIFEIYCIDQKDNRYNNQRINRENQRILQRLANFNNQLNINFHHNNLNEHDRYIRIYKNNKIIYEIILSSGIYYLEDNNKDLTYVVRIF